MARTVDQIIKQQLGGLLTEIAVLTAEIEARDEKIASLEKLANVAKTEDVQVTGKTVEELPDGQVN